MAKGRKMKRSKSRRLFSKTAAKTPSVNLRTSSPRGGFRF